MSQQKAATLHQIEDLLTKRLNIFMHYPVLSAEAMQCLEQGDAEGFDNKLDERGSLADTADVIYEEISNTVSKLDESSAVIVLGLLIPGQKSENFPEWAGDIARIMERTYILLQNCALFDARLQTKAKQLHMDIQKQLGGLRAQRKINAVYTKQSAGLQRGQIRQHTK